MCNRSASPRRARIGLAATDGRLAGAPCSQVRTPGLRPSCYCLICFQVRTSRLPPLCYCLSYVSILFILAVVLSASSSPCPLFYGTVSPSLSLICFPLLLHTLVSSTPPPSSTLHHIRFLSPPLCTFCTTLPTLPGSRLRPKTLQVVDVPILDSRLCEDWHRQKGINVIIYDEMMCAG